jgi:hypothetical protein
MKAIINYAHDRDEYNNYVWYVQMLAIKTTALRTMIIW